MRLFSGLEISLEDAERVVKAHHDAETAKRAAELRRFIGRFFKRQGGYSEFITDGDSWTYGMPTKVSGDYPHVSGLSFRNSSHGLSSGISVIRNGSVDVERGGWIEIEADEFWSAARMIRSEMIAVLTPESEAVQS